MKATTKDHPRLKFQVFGTLLGAFLLASLAGIPYSLALLKQQAPPIGAMLLGVLLQLAITALIAALGLWLGSKVRLGVPILQRLLAGTPDALPRFLASLRPAISLGVIGGGLLIIASEALKPLLPQALVQTEIPGPLPALES